MAIYDDGPDVAQDGTFHALTRSLAMIIVSEIGDKTFLIAAILAMRHPRLVVFTGAFSSLAVMSVLSAALGHLLPALIPKRWTQASAAVLFLVFGAKMLQEGRSMRSGSDKMQEEMKEAEHEIEGDVEGGESLSLEDLEEGAPSDGHGHAMPNGNGHALPRRPRAQSHAQAYVESARDFFSLFLGPVFVQSFILTFLGEWGDRSQISTIALAAAHNVYAVTFGTILGHSMCTALAVIGGRYVSTKISVKHVTFAGSALFLIFGVLYLYEAFLFIDPDDSDFVTPS